MGTGNRRWCGFFLLASLAGCWLLPGAGSQAHESAANPEQRVVVRVSNSVLNSLMDNEYVDRLQDVQDVIMGTLVVSRARTTGQPQVKLVESADKAVFQITLNGVTHSQNTGYNGPAIIYSHSVTNFTATRLVVFEPGKGFRGLAVKVTARTSTVIDGVDSTRGGLIGRIVRRRASGTAASQLPQAQEIARQRAERRIQLAFGKSSDVRLAKMNEAADLRALAAATALPKGNGAAHYRCCTTPHYFQIATTYGECDAPIQLPVDHPENPEAAPIEVWVNESLLANNPLAASLELLNKQPEVNQLMPTVSAAANLLSNTSALDNLPALFGQPALKFNKVAGWRVAKLDLPAKEAAQVVRALRPQLPANGAKLTAKTTVLPPPNRTAQASGTPASAAEALPAKNAGRATPHRIWTSGKYTAHARFLELQGDTVRLQRSSGVNTQIAFAKLSPVDQSWIEQYLGLATSQAALQR